MYRALLFCLLFLYVPVTSFAHFSCFDGHLDLSSQTRSDRFNCQLETDDHEKTKIDCNINSSLQLEATARLLFCHRYYFRAFAAHAGLFDTESSTDWHACDFSGGVGYHFCFCRGRYALTPLVGYAHYQYQLETFCLFLNKTQHPIWQGPWVGFEAAWKLARRCNILADFTYLIGSYRNSIKLEEVYYFPCYELKTTLSEHSNCIHGVGTRINYDYFVNNWFSIGVCGSYRYFWAKSGTFKFYQEYIDNNLESPQLLGEFEGDLSNLSWQTWTFGTLFAFHF